MIEADDDQLRLEHAIASYRGLSDAGLAGVPGTSPRTAGREAGVVPTIIIDFLTAEACPPITPVRGAVGRADCRAPYGEAGNNLASRVHDADGVISARPCPRRRSRRTEVRREEIMVPYFRSN